MANANDTSQYGPGWQTGTEYSLSIARTKLFNPYRDSVSKPTKIASQLIDRIVSWMDGQLVPY